MARSFLYQQEGLQMRKVGTSGADLQAETKIVFRLIELEATLTATAGVLAAYVHVARKSGYSTRRGIEALQSIKRVIGTKKATGPD
jgi:hypothetical protein